MSKHFPLTSSAVLLSVLLGSLLPLSTLATEQDYKVLDAFFDHSFQSRTSALVAIPTYRSAEPTNKQTVVQNLERVRETLKSWADTFNAGQKTLQLEFFEWRENADDSHPWVFGFRLGNGPRKFAILTHLDTVAPGNDAWRPFQARIEKRHYRGRETDFLIGRGALDDKGPAVVSLIALEALARNFDETDRLADFTFEVLFDTSEETDMSTPAFYTQNPGALPELGLVYDAMWTVAYEKGIERPVFSVPLGAPPASGLWIESLETYPGPSNQIADSATAVIRGSTPALLAEFAGQVQQSYPEFGFDDPAYRKAPLTISADDHGVTLQTRVSGAQHGSAPQENRAGGANPLVSLAGFLAHLADTQVLAQSGIAQMVRFMAWGWGTQVFGEKHPALLARHDDIFKADNGTTYALTRFVTDAGHAKATLEIDIRYALLHHHTRWDGRTAQTLPGNSDFAEILMSLVADFNAQSPGAAISVTTRTAVGPDLKDPRSPQFAAVLDAFAQVTGQASPILAIGGGTDAKGHAELIAAGALFTDKLGPPVNFHGIDEGAPIEDLRQGARILYQLLLNQISPP